MELNQNERAVLENLAKAIRGKSWKGATLGIDMSESGARGLLERLEGFGLVIGRPNAFRLTTAGKEKATAISKSRKGQTVSLF